MVETVKKLSLSQQKIADMKDVDTAKRVRKIKERLLRKQEEPQKEPNPAKSDSDTTGTTLEEKTRKNMERRRKASYQDDEKADNVPESRRNSCEDEREEKAHEEGEVLIVILNQARRPPMKEKDHTMKMSQGRRQPRGY